MSRRLRCYNAVAVICLLGFLYAAWAAGRMGLARTLAVYAVKASLIAPGSDAALESVDRATTISPSDPEAHSARGTVLAEIGRPEESALSFERAVALRPNHHVLWLKLGSVRDIVGDEGGAEEAFLEAVRLAPQYAEPRWQLGNVLFRMGKFEEAFSQMRRAAATDPPLLPLMIDLAWGVYGGDARAVERAVGPRSKAARLVLARFFVKHGKTDEALALFRTAGGLSEEEQRSLLSEFLNARRFKEAFEVWSSDHSPGGGPPVGVILNGGFEEPIEMKGQGFGWRKAEDPGAVRLSLDAHNYRTGGRSLMVDWGGKSEPSAPVFWQLVLVDPDARYRLRFAARAQELVTGGLPLIVVADASSKDEQVLARSQMFQAGTSDWREYSVEFTAPKGADAVLVRLQRQPCGGDCPAFGRVWFDDFSLERLK